MYKKESQKDAFLEEKKAARESRAQEKKKEEAAIKVQSLIRGWLQRRRYTKLIL